MHLLSLFLYYMGGGKSAQASVHVVYNMEELENEELLEALNEDIGVKGESVSVGTGCETNVNIPQPTPAVPNGSSVPTKGAKHNEMITSESGSGKATKVTSAGTQGNVPMAPPLPYGSSGAGADDVTFNSTNNSESTTRSIVHDNDHETHNEDLIGDSDHENVKSYPPGGVPVYEDEKEDEAGNLLT